MDGFKFKPVHGIDLPGIQGGRPGRDIRDTDGFHLVEVRAPL
jgi:hypothetical protein